MADSVKKNVVFISAANGQIGKTSGRVYNRIEVYERLQRKDGTYFYMSKTYFPPEPLKTETLVIGDVVALGISLDANGNPVASSVELVSKGAPAQYFI